MPQDKKLMKCPRCNHIFAATDDAYNFGCVCPECDKGICERFIPRPDDTAPSFCITIWHDEICVSVNRVYENSEIEELIELKHFNKHELSDALTWIYRYQRQNNSSDDCLTRGFQEPSGSQISDETSESPNPVKPPED